jgi:hypothetical protein
MGSRDTGRKKKWYYEHGLMQPKSRVRCIDCREFLDSDVPKERQCILKGKHTTSLTERICASFEPIKPSKRKKRARAKLKNLNSMTLQRAPAESKRLTEKYLRDKRCIRGVGHDFYTRHAQIIGIRRKEFTRALDELERGHFATQRIYERPDGIRFIEYCWNFEPTNGRHRRPSYPVNPRISTKH